MAVSKEILVYYYAFKSQYSPELHLEIQSVPHSKHTLPLLQKQTS
jgi:hypothetical protein